MMKNILMIFCIISIFNSPSLSQTRSERLKIYSVTEYVDGYVIKAIDTLKSDTLDIISVKDKLLNSRKFAKMKVGRSYNFIFEDISKNMAAVPVNSFVVKIKTTVVWWYGSGVKKLPFLSKNTKGLSISNTVF